MMFSRLGILSLPSLVLVRCRFREGIVESVKVVRFLEPRYGHGKGSNFFALTRYSFLFSILLGGIGAGGRNPRCALQATVLCTVTPLMFNGELFVAFRVRS